MNLYVNERTANWLQLARVQFSERVTNHLSKLIIQHFRENSTESVITPSAETGNPLEENNQVFGKIDHNNLSPMEKTFLRMAPQSYEKEGLRILNETRDTSKAIEHVTEHIFFYHINNYTC